MLEGMAMLIFWTLFIKSGISAPEDKLKLIKIATEHLSFERIRVRLLPDL